VLGYEESVERAQGYSVQPVKGSLTRDFRLQVFFINQCPPKSATAADNVIGHSHENAQRHLTNHDQRPRRPPKLL
jgi:hypothetical protein